MLFFETYLAADCGSKKAKSRTPGYFISGLTDEEREAVGALTSEDLTANKDEIREKCSPNENTMTLRDWLNYTIKTLYKGK